MAVHGSFLSANKTLQPGDSLVSQTGKYVAYFDETGMLGLYQALKDTDGQPDLTTRYWQTQPATGSHPWAIMQNDTNFVLYGESAEHDQQTGQNSAYFDTRTVLNIPGITALLDDGNLVVCTGPSAADPQEIVWSALPTVSAQCKFMQNYRVTIPVNGGPEVLAIKTSTGSGIELFTLGTGGDIHSFYPDQASETGYSQVTLTSGINFTHLAGAADAAGHAVLFASSGQQIYVLAETADPSKRWGSPQPVPTALMNVTDMVARTINGTVILLAIQQDSAGNYWPAAMRWGIDDKVNPNAQLKVPSYAPLPLLQVTQVAAGGPAEPVATLVQSGKLALWGLNSGKVSSVPTSPAPLTPRNVDITTDGTGAEWIVGTPPGQPVCRLMPAAGGGFAWTPLWQPLFYMDDLIEFLHVVAETDTSGGVHIFAASAPQIIIEGDSTRYNVLYHRPPASDTSLDPLPIHKSVGMKLAGVANDAGSIDVFTVEAANLVDHLFTEQTGSNWIAQRILDPANDDAPITEYASYATDITVYDGDRATLAGEYVDVYATDRSRVEINGLTWFLDAQTPAHVPTNGAGMLNITQETSSLASSALRVVFAAGLISPKAPVIEVDPYADIQHKLGTASAQDLLDATMIVDDDGTQVQLLQDNARTGTTPQSLASALDTFLGGVQGSGNLGSGPLATTAPLATADPLADTAGTRRARDRFWSRQVPVAGGPHQPPARLPAPVRPDRPSRITFHEDGLIFEDLTAQQATELRATSLATLPSVTSTGIGKWWSKIGDALKSVADGIAKVAAVVWDGLNATVDLFIDGVKYVFDTVVKFVEDAFDMIEMVFSYVKVFFEELYRWLSLIFDWTSMRQAQRCAVHAFNQQLQFLEAMADQLRPIAAARFVTFKTQFAGWIDDAIRDIAGSYSVGSYGQRNAPYDADADSATSNNFYLNEFISNGGGAAPTAALAAQLAASDPLTTLSDLLTQLGDLESPSNEFADAMDYFNKLGESPDAIFANLMGLLLSTLKGVVVLGMDLSAKIVDALLAAVSDVIGALRQVVQQKISIPFVSTFYKWVTKGEDLTLLNLVSLAMGIPTAILYAITTKQRMFTAMSGPGSADDFVNSYTYQDMLRAVGLQVPPGSGAQADGPQAASAPFGPTTKTTALRLSACYLTVTAIGGALQGVSEFETPDWKSPWTYISYGSLLCAGLSAAFSFPYFYAENTVHDR